MAMELKHLNPQHVMDVTGKAIDEISRLRAENAELKQKLQDQCTSCPVKMQEDDTDWHEPTADYMKLEE